MTPRLPGAGSIQGGGAGRIGAELDRDEGSRGTGGRPGLRPGDVLCQGPTRIRRFCRRSAPCGSPTAPGGLRGGRRARRPLSPARRRRGGPCWSTEADLCRGVSALFMGQLREAHHRLTLERRASGRRLPAAPRGGSDGPADRGARASRTGLVAVRLPDQAERVSQEAITAARAAGHPFVLTYALLAASWVCELRRARASRALASGCDRAGSEVSFAFLAIGSIIRDAAVRPTCN